MVFFRNKMAITRRQRKNQPTVVKPEIKDESKPLITSRTRRSSRKTNVDYRVAMNGPSLRSIQTAENAIAREMNAKRKAKKPSKMPVSKKLKTETKLSKKPKKQPKQKII